MSIQRHVPKGFVFFYQNSIKTENLILIRMIAASYYIRFMIWKAHSTVYFDGSEIFLKLL